MSVENLLHAKEAIGEDSMGNVDSISVDSIAVDPIAVDPISKKKLHSALLPKALLALKMILCSKHFNVVNGLYLLLDMYGLFSLTSTIISKHDDYGVAYSIFYICQGLLYLSSPFICFFSFAHSMENDFIAHVLLDAFSYCPKLNKKFAVITYMNLLLLIGSLGTLMLISDLSMYAGIEAGFSSAFFLVPFVLVYSWFVSLVYAQWIRLKRFLKDLRHMRNCSDIRYHAEAFPFLLDQKQQHLVRQQQQQQQQPLFEEGRGEGLEPGSPNRSWMKAKGDNNMLTTEHLSTKYYEELTVCLALSESCGTTLFFFAIFSLLLAVGVLWAMYLRLHDFRGAIAFLVITMILIFEFGFVLASCNEVGDLIRREVCNYLLSESSQRRQESNSYQEASFLLGCIDRAKLEITYFGNFSLRSRTLLAIFGSIVGAVIPGIILNS